jgi:hypothetical protein
MGKQQAPARVDWCRCCSLCTWSAAPLASTAGWFWCTCRTRPVTVPPRRRIRSTPATTVRGIHHTHAVTHAPPWRFDKRRRPACPAVPPHLLALLAHDDGRACVLTAGQDAARRHVGVLQQLQRHKLVIWRGLTVLQGASTPPNHTRTRAPSDTGRCMRVGCELTSLHSPRVPIPLACSVWSGACMRGAGAALARGGRHTPPSTSREPRAAHAPVYMGSSQPI